MQILSVVVIALASTASVEAASRNAGSSSSKAHAFLSLAEGAQPEAVARTLSKVESIWRAEALDFVECNSTAGGVTAGCFQAQKAFAKSCSTVTSAILSASSGEKDTVAEYLAEICSQPQLQGWKAETCQSFGKAILDEMSADNYNNRENLDPTKICYVFWSQMAVEESAVIAEKHKEEARRLDAERAAAEAERIAAEQARIEADKKTKEAAEKAAAEERRKKEAAERAAEEAAKKAAERAAAEENRLKREAEAEAEKEAAMATLKEAERQDELAKQKIADAASEMEATRAAGNTTASKSAAGPVSRTLVATKIMAVANLTHMRTQKKSQNATVEALSVKHSH